MKKILTWVLVISMIVVVFAACGAKEAPATEAPATEAPAAGGSSAPAEQPTADANAGGFKVASHNAVVEGNAYRTVYEDQMSEAVDAAKKDGYVSQYASFIANNDPATEQSNLEQTINEGYDIIIVNPIAASGLDAVIQKALDAGITYINADCEYDSPDILNVVVDQKEWARIQANFVIDTLGSGKKVVQFDGIDGNSASDMRSEAWKETLSAGGIEVVKRVAHNWNDVESKQLMSEIISSGIAYDGIINQEAANGILNAIEEAKVDYPGCITSSEEIAWIRRMAELNKDELKLPFIVVENPPGIGATALAIAVNLRQGGELKDGIADAGLAGNSIYYAPQWIMTYDNIQEKLDETKDMPDSTSISSYLSVEGAKALYFK